MVSEPFAFKRGITQEHNTLTLLTDQGAQTFEVVGVYYDYSTDQGSVFMTDNVYRQYFDDPYISTMAAFLKPGADGAQVLEAIRTQALAGTELVARSNRALRDSVFEVFDRTFAITAALRLLAVVVAFIGILSALMSLQLEQTRQYGVLRAIGLTPRQLWNYTLIQTGLMGVTAGVLALPIGAGAGADPDLRDQRALVRLDDAVDSAAGGTGAGVRRRRDRGAGGGRISGGAAVAAGDGARAAQ